MSSLETNKHLHLFSGYKGDTGGTGQTLYELYKEKSEHDITSDTLTYLLSSVDDVNSAIDELEESMEEVETLLDSVELMSVNANVEVFRIGTILFSATPPAPADHWLPFGNPNYTYADADYPELATMVKAMDDEFIVDSTHFRLANPDYKNRYIYISDETTYTDGKFMESQIPNITTTVRKTGLCTHNVYKSFTNSSDTAKYICLGGKSSVTCDYSYPITSLGSRNIKYVSNTTPLVVNNNTYTPTCTFSLDYNSALPDIYKKETLTEISGHCFAMNAWIKAKLKGS